MERARLDAVQFAPARRERDSPAREPARCRACRCAAASLLFLCVGLVSGRRPKRWRSASIAPAGRASRRRSKRSAGWSRTRSISSSVMCAMRCAILGGKMRHLGELFAQEHLALLVKAVRAVVDDRAGLERCAPGFEFRDVLADDRFGARNFRLARPLVLLDDLAEIVDVVEIDVVKTRGAPARCCAARPDRPRTRAFRRGAMARSSISRESTGSGCHRRNNNVRQSQRGSSDSQSTASPPTRRASSCARSQERLTTRSCDAAVAQMLDHLFGDGARAQDQRRVALQAAENSLGKLHSRKSHRHRPRANFGFRAHALAHFERA